MKSVIWRVSLLFMPAVGSSSSRSFGRVASARAISSRRWSPYGRFRAHVSDRLSRSTSFSSDMHSAIDACSSRSMLGLRRTESHQWLFRWTLWPTRTLSSADIVPNRRMFWKVRPIPRAVTSWGFMALTFLPFVVTIG